MDINMNPVVLGRAARMCTKMTFYFSAQNDWRPNTPGILVIKKAIEQQGPD